MHSSIIRRCLSVLFIVIASHGSGLITAYAEERTRLEAVDKLPEPPIPSLIESITPYANTTIKAQGQISILFRHPLAPLGRIDQAESKAVLSYFSVTPQIPGKFRLANPNLVVFEPDESLPASSRIEVSIKRGLKDLEGNRINEDIRWTFETERMKVTVSAPTPAPLSPVVSIYTSTPVYLADLNKALRITSGPTSVTGFSVETDPRDDMRHYALRRSMMDSTHHITALLREQSKPEQVYTRFVIKFSTPLQKATSYSIEVAAELLPAYGNLSLGQAESKNFDTYHPLQATLHFTPWSAVFTGGSPELKFNNSLAPGAEKFIQVSPLPKAKDFVSHYGNTINFDERYFKAQTAYTLTLKKGLKDIFGQTVEGDTVFTLTTSDYIPGLWAPDGVMVLQPALHNKLTVHYVNTGNVHYAWRALTLKDLQQLGDSNDIYSSQLRPLLPDEGQWQDLAPSDHNRLITKQFSLPKLLKEESGVLVYGVAATVQRDQHTQKSELFGLIARTDLGVYNQWLPQEGRVQVYSLASGKPVTGAAVKVYTLHHEGPCVTGLTDRRGGIHWGARQLRQCIEESGSTDDAFKSAPHLLIEIRKDRDWTFAFSHINTHRNYSDYSEYISDEERMSGRAYPGMDWTGKRESRGVLFSDRFMYKPGEQVTLTAMVRFMRYGKLYTPKDHPFNVELTDPDGNNKKLGQLRTNEYGSFTLSVPLAGDAKLGFWRVTAKSSDPDYQLNGSFRVAEFRAPPFKVQAKADKGKAYARQDVAVDINADYLHGAPLSGAKAQVHVTRMPFSPVFANFEEFQFGKPYIYRELEKQPLFENTVLQQGLILDNEGKSSLQVKIGELPYPVRYAVEAEVSDASNASLTGKASFEAYPSRQLVGIKVHDYVVSATAPMRADITVLDINGKPVSGVKVNVVLKRIEWNSTLRALQNGLELEQRPTLEIVKQQTITSGAQPVTIDLLAKQGGHHVIEATIDGVPATLSAGEVFVVGGAEASWYQSGNETITLRLNKNNYKIGDTANVLVQSPYPRAEVLFSVLRDRLFYRERRTIKGSSALFSFKITEDMLPNAQVQVTLTRRGNIHSAKHLARSGSAYFSVNHEQLALKIDLAAEHTTLEPRQQQTIKIKLSDADNKPVRGQVSVLVVNEAILQLNEYRPPNLLNTLYSPFPLDYIAADNRDYVQLATQFRPFSKGWGYGGGIETALANNLLRKNFQPLPFYRLDTLTNAQGEAQVSFTMPDDLTTWRVMAIAADDQQRFGNNDSTFKTSKALIADPILPRFARLNDTFEAGVQIINNSKKQGSVKISGKISPPLSFVTKQGLRSRAEWNVQLTDKPIAQRVPIRVAGLGEGNISFHVQGEGALQGLQDGFQLSLKNVLHQPLEATVQVGATEQAATAISLNTREGVDDRIGGLTVEAASSLMPNIVEPLDYMIQYPFGCLEQTATRLIALANMKWLSSHYGFSTDQAKLQDAAARALKHLLKMQTSSGGFSFWVGQRDSTYPPINAHAARALQALQENGFAVSAVVTKKLVSYLDEELRSVKKFHFSWHEIALDEIRGLEALGVQRDDYLQEIFAARSQLGQLARLKLAIVLSSRPNWKNDFDQLMQELRNQMVFDERTAQLTGNTGHDLWSWLGDMQVQQALALYAFARYPQADQALVDRLLRGLLDAREKGLWHNTYSNAQALDALVFFARAREMQKPDYRLEVKLENNTLMQETFDQFKQTDVFTPMQQLPKGKSVLKFNKQGAGTLHYLVSYRYTPVEPAPGRDSGIHVTRSLFNVDQDKPIKQWTEAVPSEALTLESGKTYRVKLQVILKQWSSHVALSDLLPAGLEAVDTRLATSSGQYKTDDEWSFSYKETGDQRVDAFIDEANSGAYDLEYFVRAVTPGKFTWPGGEALLMYAPETFGRTAASTLEIK